MNISNRTLLSLVFLLLLVDAVVIVMWSQISGIDIESPAKPHCYTAGDGANIFPAVFAALKGLILLAGIYLTFKVRSGNNNCATDMRKKLCMQDFCGNAG